MASSLSTTEVAEKWKEKVFETFEMMYGRGNVDKDELLNQLDEIINTNMRDAPVTIVNNYRNTQFQTSITGLADTLWNAKPIIGGDGVLFAQPDETHPNPLVGFILNIMGLRNQMKANRKMYDDDTPEWIYYDLLQLNYKIIINTLYGVLGYRGFPFYNLFLAQSVTCFGQNIITSASIAIENFLADNASFNTTDECFGYLLNIRNEWEKKYQNMDFYAVPDIPVEKVVKRILKKCQFDITTPFINRIHLIVKTAPEDLRKLFFFKNNLIEFSRLPFVLEKYRYILTTVPKLHAAKLDLIKDEKAKELFEEIWKFYDIFVLYRYPIFDTVRKTKYTKHKAVLYIDTDSNFVSLNQWVNFMRDSLYGGAFGETRDEEEFKIVNLAAIIVTRVLDGAMGILCDSSNIVKYRELLNLKNEFFFKKILFTLVKKRYGAWVMLKEGQMLNSGKGKLEIKGFDFIKAGTKKSIRDFYENILLEDILKQDDIDVVGIFNKMVNFQKTIRDSLLSGDTQYYKQANISIIDHYKKPYSIQGIKGVTLWNALFPDSQIELPAGVDIIPIKDLTKKKTLAEFESKFPEQYLLLKTRILDNPNPTIAKMGLNVIAKPNIEGFQNPEWLNWLINTDKIINDAISLFNPILESIGVNLLNLNSNTQVLSNFVSL